MDSVIKTITDVAKIAFLVGVSSFFLIAIINLLSLLSDAVSTSVVGEFFSLISMCLPFDSNSIFKSIGLAIAGILSFMVSAKIYNLFHLSFFDSIKV